MSFTKCDNITRSALWIAYNCVCFYCSQNLDWDELHIDHIIPESLNNTKEYFDVLKKYELMNGFNINSLYNLVPSHNQCNLRKGKQLFSKATTLYYLELTQQKTSRIVKEIEKIKARKNRGQIISKIQNALESQLVTTDELRLIISKAEKNNWNLKSVKLDLGISFLDDIFDTFYFGTDYSFLYDKKLFVGGGYDYLVLENDEKQDRNVSTLNEWLIAIKEGFYPRTNAAIKMSSIFTHLEELITALKISKMPKVSFISEPWIDLTNLDLLSPSIINDYEGKLLTYHNDGYSVGDLVKNGIVKVNASDRYTISLEFEGLETSLREQFRADFNGDGIEDMFVRGWTRAVGGTLGFGFTTILTRYSDLFYLQEIYELKDFSNDRLNKILMHHKKVRKSFD